MKPAFAIVLSALVVTLANPSHAEGDAAKGEKVFKKCKACHEVGESAKSKTGPVLNGIIDAPAARDTNFGYSDALNDAAQAGLVWDTENLTAFLTKPRDVVPDTKMSFSGLRKESDVENLLAYLATVN